jgi:hypothetical protein
VLAGELAKVIRAPYGSFANYEKVLRAFIDAKQRGAERFAAAFAPKSRWGYAIKLSMRQQFRVLCVPKTLSVLMT